MHIRLKQLRSIQTTPLHILRSVQRVKPGPWSVISNMSNESKFRVSEGSISRSSVKVRFYYDCFRLEQTENCVNCSYQEATTS